MNIFVDLDDTLLDSSAIKKAFEEYYGKKIKDDLIKEAGYHLDGNMLGLELLYHMDNTNWFLFHDNQDVSKGAESTLKMLTDKGHDLYVLTARPEIHKEYSKEQMRGLDKYFKDLFFVGFSESKLDFVINKN